MPARSRAGFTLIELLVVIGVIALLVGLLLPALKRARLSGWQAVSLSNCRGIGQAGAMYQASNKGELPIVPTGVPVPNVISAWITWGAWGKFCSPAWRRPRVTSDIFDIAPASRPLNSYLYPDHLPTKEEGTAGPRVRTTFQLPMFRDPSDKVGHQQKWNAFSPTFGVVVPNADGTTCYDDVGTSYLLQCKWFFQTNAYLGAGWTKAWNLGAQRMKLSDSFDASRMVWFNDENFDITINQTSDRAQIKNGYGDINRGMAGFLDGHVKYVKIIPGGEGDPRRLREPWLVPAFNNSEYSVVFPDLR